jgi:hypothetical protein
MPPASTDGRPMQPASMDGIFGGAAAGFRVGARARTGGAWRTLSRPVGASVRRPGRRGMGPWRLTGSAVSDVGVGGREGRGAGSRLWRWAVESSGVRGRDLGGGRSRGARDGTGKPGVRGGGHRGPRPRRPGPGVEKSWAQGRDDMGSRSRTHGAGVEDSWGRGRGRCPGRKIAKTRGLHGRASGTASRALEPGGPGLRRPRESGWGR